MHRRTGSRWRARARRVVAALAVVTVLGGCDYFTNDQSSGGRTVLTFALWDKTQEPAARKMATAFERQHPDITVDVQTVPVDQYVTKLQTEVRAGTAPDVFWLSPNNIRYFAGNGAVARLDARIRGAGLDLGAFPAAATDQMRYRGGIYGLPNSAATIGLWYNRSLFAKAGVAPPTSSWTYADLRSAARKLTDRAHGVYGIAAALDSQQNYYNSIFANGGRVLSADGKRSGLADPKSVAGLSYWTDLIHQGVSPTQQQMTETTADALFGAGKVAMFFGGSWTASEFAQQPALRGKVDVAPLPKGPAGRGNNLVSVADAMYARTRHPAQAWQFLQFLGSRRGASIQAAAGSVPPAYRATDSLWVRDYPQFHAQVFIDAFDYAEPYPVSQNTQAWLDDVDKALLPAWSSGTGTAGAARRAAAVMNADLAKESR